MRILLVSQYFWPERFRVNDLVTGWQERGHEVTVLTGVPNYPSGSRYPGYSYFPLSRDRYGESWVVRVPLIVRGNSTRARLTANYASFALSASVLGPLRCRGRFDCVFVNQLSPVTVAIPGVVAKRWLGVPMAMWIQDLWPESVAAVGAVRSRRVLGAVGRLVDWTYRRCDTVFVQSRGFESAVRERGVDRQRLRYLPNWCESFYGPVEVGADAPERKELPKGFVFLFAGNLGDAQALTTILEAATRLRDRRDLQWVFLGDGRRRRALQEQIENRGLQATVHWLGLRSPEGMSRWFAAADALLLTLRAGQAMAMTVPVKLQSYMACARPILAAIDGEAGGIVDRAGAGIVGPAEDAERLAENATAMAALPAAHRAAMGECARAYYLENFERERLLDRLDGWLHEMCAASGGPGR